MPVLKKDVSNFVEDSMMGMSAYSLLHRAIPDLRDGLKPVHRRILISMYMNKTFNFTKSATVEGRVMQLHPHGGSYGSMVGLVQKDRNNIPFLSGKGSWGQYTSKDQAPAAARYTEIKLGENAKEIMKELKEKSVNYIDNYDGTIRIPEVLPTTYPTILTQAQSGMAIGFSSSTLSYNIHELYQAIEKILKGKDIGIIYPDFATGGIIVKNDEEAKSIIDSGKGSLSIRSKVEIVGNKIYVHEIPYRTTREQIIQKIIDLNKKGSLKEVIDVRDATSFKGMKISITLRKNADPKEVLVKLFKWTPMQSSVSANMNILIDGFPRVAGVKETLEEWIKWRKSIIIKGIENKIESLEKEYHILSGLKKIDPDEAIKIIRFEKSKDILKKLMKSFDLDEVQAEYVLKMPLRILNQESLDIKINEIDNLESQINLLKDQKDNNSFIEEELLKRMRETIKAIQPNKDRKTLVKEIKQNEEKVIKKIKQKVKEENNYKTDILITKMGLIYKTKNGSIVGDLLKGDEVIEKYSTMNSSSIMAILPQGKLGRIKISDLKDGIYNPFEEEILGYINPSSKYVMLGFEDGQLVVIPGEKFDLKVTLTKNGYYKDSKICLVEHLDSLDGTIIAEYGKKKKEISMDKINIKVSKASKGQRFINPKDGIKVKYLLK